MNLSIPAAGIPVDVMQYEGAACHIVGEKYVNAIVHGARCYPVLLPAMSRDSDLGSFTDRIALRDIVAGLDGVFLPGSYSNIHAEGYGGDGTEAVPPVDRQRDDLTLDLILACLDQQVPLLAACRGFQE